MIRLINRRTIAHDIKRTVFRAVCDDCGKRWAEAHTEYAARLQARGHECEGQR